MAVIVDGTTLSATTSTTGSWTPTFVGTVNNNMSYAMGRYYKIGKLVYCVARYHTPHGNNSGANNSGGLGDNSSNNLRIGGLPFTSANTGQVIANWEDGHFGINAYGAGQAIQGVIFSNVTEVRFFGKGTELDGSYGSSSGQGSPSRGNELTVGNAHINWNDGSGKVGYASFVYYTDTA